MTILTPDLMSGKIVLVSGGTQGVGAACAFAAADSGAEAVVVTGRRPQLGESVAISLNERGTVGRFIRCDVADPMQAMGAVGTVIEEFGRVDAVVNAAGLVTRGSLLDTSVEMFDEHVAINLRGPFLIMQAAVRDMVGRGAPGSIVNILSMASHGGQPFLAGYVASKSGLAGLTKNAAHAHRSDRIRINGLNIGWTSTEGEDIIQRSAHGAVDGWLADASSQVPMGKLGQPDEIADMVVFLLSDRSGVVTGSIIDWDQIVMGGID